MRRTSHLAVQMGVIRRERGSLYQFWAEPDGSDRRQPPTADDGSLVKGAWIDG